MSDKQKITILIVDDSALTRSLIEKSLSKDPDLQIIGYAANGELAIESTRIYQPDIVILDIEMPIMDGITALPLIKKEKHDAQVLICSTLSSRGADVTLKALSLGASDYICKPGSSAGVLRTSDEFQQELVDKVHVFGKKIKNSSTPLPTPTNFNFNRSSKALSSQTLNLIAIGSSTGGPNALILLLNEFHSFQVPIVITQHMPKMFTNVLAHHIADTININCVEAEEGMILEAGKVYIAPGDYHMEFEPINDQVRVVLNDGPMENFCRPSVDPMMRSLIKLFGRNMLGIILTGMGKDGLEGCRELVEIGGTIIAQDKETSVVWGMPGAVYEAGITTQLLPPEQMGPWIKHNYPIIQYRINAQKTA